MTDAKHEDVDPEIVADLACQLGEGPLWHRDQQCLYWLDIPRSRLLRYDPASGASEVFEIGAPAGGFTIQENGELLLFMARGAIRTWHDGRFTGTVLGELPGELDNRFNDVIADPEGRVFCGTLSTATRPGKLYRLDLDGSIIQVLDGVGTSNGMGFTPDGRAMYHTDTRPHEIRLFDYERGTGAIANRRVFVRVDEGDARPDGMTVDAEGCVWSAMWEGGRIVRYDPSGHELLRITLPARKASCVTFGGPDYADLYVTTAGGDARDEQGAGAGALFRLRPGVKGVPEFRSRIRMGDVCGTEHR